MKTVLILSGLALASTACDKPAPLPPAQCSSAGLCTDTAPVCFGQSQLAALDAAIMWSCIPLDPCASDPTCPCFEKAATNYNGRYPYAGCYQNAELICTITDAGVQLVCHYP